MRTLVWIAIMSTWEAAYRIVQWESWQFPAPSHIVDALAQMTGLQTAFGEPLHTGWPRVPADQRVTLIVSQSPIHIPIIEGAITSLTRLLVSFIVSLTIGSLLGVLMWRSDAVNDFLGPLFLGLQTLPSVCWVPLAIIAFGLSEWAILFVVVMGSAFAVALSLRDGLRSLPPIYRRAGLMLGARNWRLYRFVLLPASLPALASSLRSGFSFAWRALMGAEFVLVAVKWRGFGFLLEAGRNNADVAQVVAVMMLMVAVGILVDRFALAKMERRIQDRFGLFATE